MLDLPSLQAPQALLPFPPNPKFSYVVVLTDASFLPKEKVSGWAAFLSFNTSESETYYGSFTKFQPSSPTEAEICAIINGLFLVFSRHPSAEWNPKSVISISTDSKDAIIFLREILLKSRRFGFNPKDPIATKAFELMKKCEERSIMLSFQHVKAHKTEGATTRHQINNLLDKLAKKGALMAKKRSAASAALKERNL